MSALDDALDRLDDCELTIIGEFGSHEDVPPDYSEARAELQGLRTRLAEVERRASALHAELERLVTTCLVHAHSGSRERIAEVADRARAALEVPGE